jgi:hypothetical protein
VKNLSNYAFPDCAVRARRDDSVAVCRYLDVVDPSLVRAHRLYEALHRTKETDGSALAAVSYRLAVVRQRNGRNPAYVRGGRVEAAALLQDLGLTRDQENGNIIFQYAIYCPAYEVGRQAKPAKCTNISSLGWRKL